jgi:hypothetical protein
LLGRHRWLRIGIEIEIKVQQKSKILVIEVPMN